MLIGLFGGTLYAQILNDIQYPSGLVISNHVNLVFVRYFDDTYVVASFSGVM
jgi:hypothetical protein